MTTRRFQDEFGASRSSRSVSLKIRGGPDAAEVVIRKADVVGADYVVAIGYGLDNINGTIYFSQNEAQRIANFILREAAILKGRHE